MGKVNDIETLEAEISRLKAAVTIKEQRIKEHVTQIRNSLKPANILSNGIHHMIGNGNTVQGKGFFRESVKTGLLLLAGNVFLKPTAKGEQRVENLVDLAFDKFRSFIQRKRDKKKKTERFYKFKDEYDTESN